MVLMDVNKLSEFDIARLHKFQKEHQPQDHEPTISELFDPLIQKHTQFSSIIDFFADGGFDVKSTKDLKTVDMDKLDEYIKKTYPGLHNWKNIEQGAVRLYLEEISKKQS
ncbi:MAG: hypothetical protein ACYCX2_05280 [Christensenellales bacterium]